jgi:hypothetical protein
VFDFTGTGNLASSDVIDLRDVAYAAGTTTESYSGTSSSGTLTVSDAQHDTANILFAGNYLSSTFTLSSDGHGGIFVIDPPIGQALSGGVLISNDAVSSGAQTLKIMAQESASGSVESFAPVVVNALNGQGGAGGQLNVDPNSIGRTITQSYNVPPPASVPSDANGDKTQSVAVTIARPATDYRLAMPSGLAASPVVGSDSDGTGDHVVYPGAEIASAFDAAPAADSAAAEDDGVPTLAREIVSPRDLIRAVNDSNIAIKVGDGVGERAYRRVWLFDDAGGTFVAPDPEPLTIVIDRAEVPVSPTHPEHSLGIVTAAAVVAAGPSWLGVLRQFGRKAALAVQQRARWTE